jgi:hypothetical protein
MELSKTPRTPNLATRLSFFLPLGLLAVSVILLVVLLILGAILTIGTAGMLGPLPVAVLAGAIHLIPYISGVFLFASGIPCLVALIRVEPARYFSIILPVFFGILSPVSKAWIHREPDYIRRNAPLQTRSSESPPSVVGESPTFPIDERHIESRTGGKTYLVEFTSSDNESIAVPPQRWVLGGRHNQLVESPELAHREC